jgi:hypothetical protein
MGGSDVDHGWNQQTPFDRALSQDHGQTPALADWLRALGAETGAQLGVTDEP